METQEVCKKKKTSIFYVPNIVACGSERVFLINIAEMCAHALHESRQRPLNNFSLPTITE